MTTADLPTNAGHPFFEHLNRVLDEAGFDAYVEELCAEFYAARMGRPSLRPGRYFRMLLIGYFEGISSERGIAWRVADSLSLRSFLDLDVTEASPDHSTLSRTRRLIDVETHEAVFTWVLERVSAAGLVRGKTVGVDATTLEANAAMRSIERRDTGESHEAFIRRLAEASGMETPTRAELARFDRSRKDKKTSNKDWKSPHDPDAKIAKMKDGRTHLAYKAEHGVDMDTGVIVSVTVQDASEGDTATLPATLTMAAEQVELAQPDGPGVEEVVADKGYHSDAMLVGLGAVGVRSHVSEPERGRRCWQDKKTGETPPEKRAAQKALYANRRRVRGRRGRRLQRCRGEVVERTFAHMYETGGMRRVWVRGHENVRKRVLIQAAACNIGLLLRHQTGIGTPRSLQGRALSAIFRLIGRLIDRWGRLRRAWGFRSTPTALVGSNCSSPSCLNSRAQRTHFFHGLLWGVVDHLLLSQPASILEHYCPTFFSSTAASAGSGHGGRVSGRQLKVGGESATLSDLPCLGKRPVVFLVEVRLQDPEVLIVEDAAIVLLRLPGRHRGPSHRHILVPSPTHRRVCWRIPACDESMRLVDVRHRRSSFGRPRRLTVNISASPSRRLAAADGHSRSSHDAYCSSFWMPASASSLHAARSVARACSCCSFGRWLKTFRTLWDLFRYRNKKSQV